MTKLIDSHSFIYIVVCFNLYLFVFSKKLRILICTNHKLSFQKWIMRLDSHIEYNSLIAVDVLLMSSSPVCKIYHYLCTTFLNLSKPIAHYIRPIVISAFLELQKYDHMI